MADRQKDIENTDEVPGRTQAKPCQPCVRKNAYNVAEVYCEDCGEYQCIECANVHQLFPVMATHTLINISDTKCVSRRYDMKGLDLCKLHGETLKFLCEDDNKLCCSTCAFVSHRKCRSVMEIEEKAKVGDPVLTKLKKDLLDIDSERKMFQQLISEIKERLLNDEKETVCKIQDMQDKVNELFEELKKKMSYDIASFKKQAISDLDTNMVSCDTDISDIEQYLSDVENVTQQGTPIQQIIMFYHLKEHVRQLQQVTKKRIEELKGIKINFEFDEHLKLPPTKSDLPGRLTLEYFTIGKSQGDDKEKQQNDQKLKLKLLSSVDLKQCEGDVGEPLYSGLDFLPDGRLVTMDNWNKKCLVYNEQLQLLGSFPLPNVPQDVVAVSGDIVAVTTEGAKLMHFLKILDNNKISLKESRKVTFKYESISVIDNERFAVGTIDNQQPVRIVSMSGEEKECDINIFTNTYPRDHSSCTYIQSCNKVVLSDKYAHTVYIYDIASNSRVDVKDETKVNEPRGVSVGPGDCIFVCSRLTNTLVQISHTGHILSSHVLDMEYPYIVSVSKDNSKLAVSNNANGKMKIQLYNIETQ